MFLWQHTLVLTMTAHWLSRVQEGGDGGCGLQSRVKVVHSPLNKENCPKTPHSQWSPVRRKPVMTGEEFIQCTKRTLK